MIKCQSTRYCGVELNNKEILWCQWLALRAEWCILGFGYCYNFMTTGSFASLYLVHHTRLHLYKRGVAPSSATVPFVDMTK